jgi:hypothetical protein
MTWRGSIRTSAPVSGFRPTRLPLLRTVNALNPDSLTVSPASREVQVFSRTC